MLRTIIIKSKCTESEKKKRRLIKNNLLLYLLCCEPRIKRGQNAIHDVI